MNKLKYLIKQLFCKHQYRQQILVDMMPENMGDELIVYNYKCPKCGKETTKVDY